MEDKKKSLDETINDIKKAIKEDGSEVIINEAVDPNIDPNEDFSQYRMDPNKKKMFNPEENVVDYGGLMEQMFGEAPSGVTYSKDVINVSDEAKSKIDDILGDFDDDDEDDDDWMKNL